MTTATLIALIATFVTTAAHAAPSGAVDGAGGNAVVCFDDPAIPRLIRKTGEITDQQANNARSVEAYDLFVAKMPSGLESKPSEIITPISGQPLKEYSELIAKRFEKHVPFVSEMIRKGAANFPDERITMGPTGLYRVHDDGDDHSYVDRTHCVVATMAMQKMIGGKLFMQIDERLFRKNSDLSKAVLFLHEAIYSTVRWLDEYEENRQLSSRNTRMLIRRLISKNNVRMKEISDLLDALKFTTRTGFKTKSDIVSILVNETGPKYFADTLDRRLKITPVCKSAPDHDAGAARIDKLSKPILRDVLNQQIFPAIQNIQGLSDPDRQTLKDGFQASVAKMKVEKDICKSLGWSWESLGCGGWLYIGPCTPTYDKLIEKAERVDLVIP